MTRNPYLNALAAAAYIVVIVSIITTVSGPDRPDNFFTPMAVLSLLTLSVVFMAYTFFYQPIMMFLEGQKKEAVSLFTWTLASFAGITVIILALMAAFQR